VLISGEEDIAPIVGAFDILFIYLFISLNPIFMSVCVFRNTC
jgi:hypothetical protein